MAGHESDKLQTLKTLVLQEGERLQVQIEPVFEFRKCEISYVNMLKTYQGFVAQTVSLSFDLI